MQKSKIMVEGLYQPKTTTEGNKITCDVWNRTYTINENPFFTSILSGGKEVLASPIRLVGKCFNEELVWEEFSNLEMDYDDGKTVSFVQSAKFEELLLNTSITIHYDGMVNCGITLAPQGYHDGKVYGTLVTQEKPLVLNKLHIEIPLKKEFAKMYHVNPAGPMMIDGEYKNRDLNLLALDFVPEKSLVMPFKHSIYLGNDHTGLSVFFDSNQYWRNEDENRVIECINQEDCVLLRIHLLDEEHIKWVNKGGFNGGYLFPIHFDFGMQATPVKPYTKNPFKEKSYHTQGVKHVNNTAVLTLDNVINEETGELFIDMLAKKGVNLLYIHEYWNDIQNSFQLTKATSERLKRIVELAHARNMKVVPYFGFEISSLSPLIKRDFTKYLKLFEENYYDFMHGMYSRKPYQRDLYICYNSDYSKIFLDGIAYIMDEYHIDGIYLDGTYAVSKCLNEEHGCGYRDEKGVLHPTYPIFAQRDMVEKLYEIVHSRNGIINIHTGNTLPVPLIAFADSCYDGETIQPFLVQGKLTEVPDGHFRSLYTGRTLGIVSNPISYLNPPVWTFHHSLSTLIAFGVLPKATPSKNEQSLEELSTVWKIYDEIPMEEATFKGYYENQITTTNDNVKVSYFDYEGGRLLIVANFSKKPSNLTTINLDEKFSCAVDKVSGQKVELNGGNSFTVDFETFDYKLIKLTK